MVRSIVSILLLAVHVSAHSWSGDCDDSEHSDRLSLACNVYFEAHVEGYSGMFAVAAATLNRVGHPGFPNTVREVVWQPRQYSWTHDGKDHVPENIRHWRTALRIASLFTIKEGRYAELCPTANQINAAMLGRADPGCEPYDLLVLTHVVIASQLDPTGGALFYHADYIPEPYWVFPEARTVKVGVHQFYAFARQK